jgi:hypothetical protein
MTLVRLLFLGSFRLGLRNLRRGGGCFAGGIGCHPLTQEEQHHVCHRPILKIGNAFDFELLVGGDSDAHNFVSNFHLVCFLSFCFGVIASASLAKIAEKNYDARHLMHFRKINFNDFP